MRVCPLFVSALSVPLALNASGFLFSAQTEKGSALHEAALFGKTDVVQKLLSAGQTSVSRMQCLNHLLLLAKIHTRYCYRH